MAALVAFDADGEHVALYGAERSLKIWDTTTGNLTQEYVPSSHLSSACTCLSWMPKQHVDQKNRRKKMKTEKTVALGTENGNILIYSVSLGDLQTEMSGHSDSVSDIQWNLTNKDLISCSRDGLIIQWDQERKPKRKWQVKREAINCMTMSADGQYLLTAGKKISLWDIEEKKVIKKFAGHTTDVIQIKLITFADQPDNGYVVSAAAGERHLRVWSFKEESRKALVTLDLCDEPVMFDVFVPASRTEKVVICAVTKTGVLQLFEQQLNGRSKRSKPQSTLRVVTEAAQPMPIRSCLLGSGASRNVTIAYENDCKLCCEIVELSSLQEDVCLVRSTAQAQEETSHSKLKIKEPDTKHSKKSLSSTSLAPNLPTQDLGRVEKRKSTKELNATQLPMDKRLGALRLDVQPGEDSKISSENVVHLLMQGLHSNDETILNQVFAVRKVDAIEKTVRRLPIETVLPVIKELQHRIHKRWNATHLLAWVKFVLITHASYLATCSELHSILNPIYQVMDVKINLLKKMCNLKGKMDLIVTRVEHRDESQMQKSAIYSFQDDSSDESDIEDGLQQDIEDEEDGNDLDQLSGSDNDQEDETMSEEREESMEEENDDSESSESS